MARNKRIITRISSRTWLRICLLPLIHKPVIEQRHIADPVHNDEVTHSNIVTPYAPFVAIISLPSSSPQQRFMPGTAIYESPGAPRHNGTWPTNNARV